MNKTILTPCGEICGCDSNIDGVIAFKGIRYANAERCQYPRIVKSWQGTYDATKYGNCSYKKKIL